MLDFQEKAKWGSDFIQFIGLNPSTADETNDDPTIRRCKYFAARLGFKAMCMTNLFAFRATDPDVMKKFVAPVGEANDEWLSAIAKDAGLVIAAWGVHGTHWNRDMYIRGLLPNLYCLGKSKEGHPRHPLYLKNTATPIPYGLVPTV